MGMFGGPASQGSEEGLVADFGSECLKCHRAAAVHRGVQYRGRGRVGGWDMPVSVVGRVVCVYKFGALGCGESAVVLVVEPFGVGGEAFVEPDVAPSSQGDTVAEPLVGEFVHDDCDV